jgi:hypothetical protein
LVNLKRGDRMGYIHVSGRKISKSENTRRNWNSAGEPLLACCRIFYLCVQFLLATKCFNVHYNYCASYRTF